MLTEGAKLHAWRCPGKPGGAWGWLGLPGNGQGLPIGTADAVYVHDAVPSPANTRDRAGSAGRAASVFYKRFARAVALAKRALLRAPGGELEPSVLARGRIRRLALRRSAGASLLPHRLGRNPSRDGGIRGYLDRDRPDGRETREPGAARPAGHPGSAERSRPRPPRSPGSHRSQPRPNSLASQPSSRLRGPSRSRSRGNQRRK